MPRSQVRDHAQQQPEAPPQGGAHDLVLDERPDAQCGRIGTMHALHFPETPRQQHHVVVEERHEVRGHLLQRHIPLAREAAERSRDANVPHVGDKPLAHGVAH